MLLYIFYEGGRERILTTFRTDERQISASLPILMHQFQKSMHIQTKIEIYVIK